jgi:hypothetical protein
MCTFSFDIDHCTFASANSHSLRHLLVFVIVIDISRVLSLQFFKPFDDPLIAKLAHKLVAWQPPLSVFFQNPKNRNQKLKPKNKKKTQKKNRGKHTVGAWRH